MCIIGLRTNGVDRLFSEALDRTLTKGVASLEGPHLLLQPWAEPKGLSEQWIRNRGTKFGERLIEGQAEVFKTKKRIEQRRGGDIKVDLSFHFLQHPGTGKTLQRR